MYENVDARTMYVWSCILKSQLAEPLDISFMISCQSGLILHSVLMVPDKSLSSWHGTRGNVPQRARPLRKLTFSILFPLLWQNELFISVSLTQIYTDKTPSPKMLNDFYIAPPPAMAAHRSCCISSNLTFFLFILDPLSSPPQLSEIILGPL